MIALQVLVTIVVPALMVLTPTHAVVKAASLDQIVTTVRYCIYILNCFTFVVVVYHSSHGIE